MWLLLPPGVLLAVWLIGLIATTDVAVPGTRITAFKKVLAVFPHADDETVSCGGALHVFARSGSEVTLLLLTGGERGNRAGQADADLKAARRLEAKRASAILGVSRLIQEDFGDGALAEQGQQIKEYLERTISSLAPDLVITFDLAGLDGHPDHVACAQALIALKRSRLMDASLWCSTLPRRIVVILRWARQLPPGAVAENRRAAPTVKMFVGSGVIPKIRAWYAYRSQRGFIAKGLGRLVPVWFAVSVMQFEYFAEVV